MNWCEPGGRWSVLDGWKASLVTQKGDRVARTAPQLVMQRPQYLAMPKLAATVVPASGKAT